LRFNDLTGKKFGRIVVLKRVANDKSGNRRWLCRCVCGTEKVIGGRHLTSGRTVSCGCYKKELKTNLIHGMRYSRIYTIWSNMKYRCKKHPDYMGRDIRVCKEWEDDFQKFHKWAIESGYSDDLSIDRIDNNGNYEPDNCRWVSAKAQANNRRSTNRIYYNGETLSIAEQCRKHGLNYNTVKTRLTRGWTVEEAMSGKRKDTKIATKGD